MEVVWAILERSYTIKAKRNQIRTYLTMKGPKNQRKPKDLKSQSSLQQSVTLLVGQNNQTVTKKSSRSRI